jgi:hypothetical protein
MRVLPPHGFSHNNCLLKTEAALGFYSEKRPKQTKKAVFLVNVEKEPAYTNRAVMHIVIHKQRIKGQAFVDNLRDLTGILNFKLTVKIFTVFKNM